VTHLPGDSGVRLCTFYTGVSCLHEGAISFKNACNNLAEVSDAVCADRNPLLITHQGGDSVVLLSWDDFRSYEETAYLLRSPKN